MNEPTTRGYDAARVGDRVRMFVLAGVLLAAALYAHLLTSIHWQMASGDRAGWACGGDGWFDCSGNLASRYGTFAGIPVSAYASAWFALMLALLLGSLVRGEQARLLHRRLLIASIPAVVAVVFYALVSVLVLKSICLYCAGVYLLVALIVMLTVTGAGIVWKRAKTVLATGIYWVVPALAFAAVVALERTHLHVDAEPAPRIELAAFEALPRVGPRHAALRIVVFSDFDCPACRLAAKELDRFLARHPGEIEVRVVSLPVHRIKALVSGDELPLSDYLSSAIGVVMHRRGRFWEYYRSVFLSDQLVDERFLWQVTAQILGPNEIHAVRRDAEKPEVLATLRRHAALARNYNIASTPGWMINGSVATGAMKVDELEARLANARRRSAGQASALGEKGTTVKANVAERVASPPAAVARLDESKPSVSAGQPIESPMDDVALAWAAHDVEAAVAWVRSLPESEDKARALVHLAPRWTEIDPRGAAACAQIQGNLPMIALVAAKWAEIDPETAGTWAAQLPIGRARQQALESLIAAWAEQSPLDAMKYVDRLPASDAAQQQARVSILARWARSDPDLVAGWMEGLRGTVLADNVLSRVIVPWSQHNPAEVAGWLSAMPAGRARDDAINSFAAVIEGQEPETAFRWAASIENDAMRNSRLESVAQVWLRKNRGFAQSAISASALPSESKRRLLESPID
jgi:uncharacterized membrane protein/protein-disulfide isomerase